jgi:C4-dicarboxylate-specific signal transduction histidine kinase
MIVVGSTAFVVGASIVLTGFVLLFASLKRNFERDLRSGVVEQRGADEIMTSVYGQLLASYRQLQSPSDANMARIDSLGQIAYQRLRLYLFQPMMSLESRMQVENIKELHEGLEVEAHQAVDLVTRGESAAARAHVAAMEKQAALLEAEMDHFVALRERERSQHHDAQLTSLQRWLAGLALLVIALGVYALMFVRIAKNRIVRPLSLLSTASAQLGAGDLSARIPPQRHSELATVAQSFNDMAARVEAARTEIEQQNRELSEALRQLRDAQRELVQQEKMGAIGVMLAGLAHELNNPLAGILGSAQVIEDELSEHTDATVRRTVNDVVKPLVIEARRAGALVRNLLQFSRKSSAEVHAVSLKDAIDVAAGLRGFAFAQAAKTLRVCVADDLFVEVEAQRLEHVAMNIMSNALDAMAAGGGSTLTVQGASTEPGWVTLSFIDDGPGFRDPERVFDPFYTTKEVGAGTGLGLTLVHRFVSEAGGTIQAANVLPSGASIVIRLRSATAPARVAPSYAIERPQPTPRSTSAVPESRTALVVDVALDRATAEKRAEPAPESARDRHVVRRIDASAPANRSQFSRSSVSCFLPAAVIE